MDESSVSGPGEFGLSLLFFNQNSQKIFLQGYDSKTIHIKTYLLCNHFHVHFTFILRRNIAVANCNFTNIICIYDKIHMKPYIL